MKFVPAILTLSLIAATSAWGADGSTLTGKATYFYLDKTGYGLIGLVVMVLVLWVGWRLEQRREPNVDDLVEYLSQTCGWGEDIFDAEQPAEKRGWAAPLQPASMHFELPKESDAKAA